MKTALGGRPKLQQFSRDAILGRKRQAVCENLENLDYIENEFLSFALQAAIALSTSSCREARRYARPPRQ